MIRLEERANAKTMLDKVADLNARRAQLEQGGGKERIDKQHASGKLTARERVAALVDKNTFEEIGLFARHRATYFGMAGKDLPADGVITGCGTVDGRLVHLASQDFTVVGGAAGETHCSKIADMMGMSLKTGSPFVFINDSGGARVQEGIDSLDGYARVFYNNVMLSGTVPQIRRHLRTMRGRRSLQPGADRLCDSDPAGPHVHHRAAGHQAGNGRSRHRRRTGRPAIADESLGRCSPDCPG